MTPGTSTPAPSPSFRGLEAAGWLLAVVLALGLLRAGKDLLVPFTIALIGVYLIKVLERWIGGWKIRGYGLPGPLPLLLAFACVVGLAWVLGTIIADNAMKVVELAPRYQTRFQKIQTSLFHSIGVEEPPALREFVREVDIPGLVTLVATNLAGLLRTSTLVIIFGIFLFIESRAIPMKVEALFPQAERRQKVEAILKRIDSDIQTYFGVKTLVSLATAILSYGVMVAVGLDLAAFWALLVFILNFIPTIGSIIATILPSLLALIQFESLVPFFVLLIGITLIQQLMGSFIEPSIVGITLNLSPLVVMLSLILWSMLWGVVGMFLCVPITVIVVLILANFPSTRWVAVLLSQNGRIQV